jgi:tripartite-type tricarboxylate transporter receptor subunit TctC
MLRRLIACLSFALVMPVALAQSWPARPVKMIVPFPAGGPPT